MSITGIFPSGINHPVHCPHVISFISCTDLKPSEAARQPGEVTRMKNNRTRGLTSRVVTTCKSAAVSVGHWVTSPRTACGKLRLSNVRKGTSSYVCLVISSQQQENSVGKLDSKNKGLQK